MKLWNHYHTPKTIDEALQLLQQYAGQARVVAGGTDLLVEMHAEDHPPLEALIDITRIPALTQIICQPDVIQIGAGVTHSQIVRSPQLRNFATNLVESCGVVGGPQVRNVGTIGGNVAHALPAGDGTTSLVALDAEAQIIHNGQQKWVPILQMYRGRENLCSIRPAIYCWASVSLRQQATLPLPSSEFMRPQGVALPVLGCAVWVKLSDTGERIEDVRFSIAPIGPTPTRINQLENALIGKAPDEHTVQYAGETAKSCIQPRTSKYRATAEYRHELVAVLVKRTLSLAIRRAKSGEIVPEGIGV